MNDQGIIGTKDGGRHRVTALVYLTSKHRGDALLVGVGFLGVLVLGSMEFTDHEGWYVLPCNAEVKAALVGRYCRVLVGKPNRPIRYRGTPTFRWNNRTCDTRKLRSLMAYHHVTTARREFESRLARLGMGAAQIDATLSSVDVVVDDTVDEWADWSGWDPANAAIRFGFRVRHILDAVAIYHEYSHAVIDRLTEERFPSAYEGHSAGSANATSVCE